MKTLSYGQTPWDDLDEEALRTLIKKMREVLYRAANQMAAIRSEDGERQASYWTGPKGAGGSAYNQSVFTLGMVEGRVQNRASLLKGVLALYIACISAQGVLNIRAWALGKPINEELNRIIEDLKQVIDESEIEGHDSEDIYRNTTCYLNDLVFANAPGVYLNDWCICPVCRILASGKKIVPGVACTYPAPASCGGILRRFQWQDIRPDLAE